MESTILSIKQLEDHKKPFTKSLTPTNIDDPLSNLGEMVEANACILWG
jgi:hypothetical protein